MRQGESPNTADAVHLHSPKRNADEVDLGCMHARALAHAALAAIRSILIGFVQCLATGVSVMGGQRRCMLQLMAGHRFRGSRRNSICRCNHVRARMFLDVRGRDSSAHAIQDQRDAEH